MILLEDQSPPDPDMPVCKPRSVRSATKRLGSVRSAERRVDHRRGSGRCLSVSRFTGFGVGWVQQGFEDSAGPTGIIPKTRLISPFFFIPCYLRGPDISFKGEFLHRLASCNKLDSRIPSNFGLFCWTAY